MVFGGEGEEVQAGDLAETMDAFGFEYGFLPQGNIVRPELVIALFDECSQARDHFRRIEVHFLAVGWTGHNSNQAVFREWAACPTLPLMRGPPIVSAGMKGVVGIKERDQHVDVQQGAHRIRHLPH